MRFYGERGLDRGHHSGLRHRAWLNPRTGEHHMQVWFHVEDFEKTKRATIYAEKRRRQGMVFPYWQWVEVTLEPNRKGFLRGRKRAILQEDSKE